jgi:3',5'-cyclic AMP phosphodiesterase CpdA
LIITGFVLSCKAQPKESQTQTGNKFSFVFMTDIHVMPELNGTEGFLQAIDTANKLNPDFVLTGGDLVKDASGQTWERSDSLFNIYLESIKKLKMPVYNTIGNHDVFGKNRRRNPIGPDHPEFEKKMYENRISKRFYSFDHKNWHFIVLDGIGIPTNGYYGVVDSVQMEWLKQDLLKTGKEKPVAISIHIPLFTISGQIESGPTSGLNERQVITNAPEVVDILQQYNVKLVLQGHQHFLEDIYYNGIHYLTGGAVSADNWKGPRMGMQEGFVKIDVSGDDFTWKYVDFGWEVAEQ